MSCREELERNPSLALLTVYFCGLAGPVYGLHVQGCLSLCTVSALVAYWKWGRSGWKWWFLYLFGVLWGYESMHHGFSYRASLPREECRVECEGRIGGVPIVGQPLEFHLLRIHDGVEWKSCRGKIRLVIPEGVDNDWSFGQTVTVTGSLLRIGSRWSADRYERHLMSMGYCHELTAEHIKLSKEADGWRRIWGRCLSFRETVGKSLVEGFRSEHLAGLYLAMFWGRRDLFPRSSREAFVRSSTVHVFAISGLHAMCLAYAWCGLLRLMGISLRAALVMSLPVVVLYVMMTGGGSSAWRAVAMMAAFGTAQWKFRRNDGRHIVCLAALVFLLWNPLLLLNIGFQFSFLVVIGLIYGQHLVETWINVLTEKRLWVAKGSNGSGRLYRMARGFLGAVGGCAMAWLAGLGETLFMNRILPVGALLVNLVVQPIASLLVAGAVPKWILSWIWKDASCLAGRFLEVGMGCMEHLAMAGGTGWLCSDMKEMTAEMLVVYLVCFGCLLMEEECSAAKKAAAVGMVIAVALAGIHTESGWNVLVSSLASDDGCAVIVTDNDNQLAMVLQMGNGYGMKMAVEELLKRGMRWIYVYDDSGKASGLSAQYDWMNERVVCEWMGEGASLKAMEQACEWNGIHVSRDNRTREGWKNGWGKMIFQKESCGTVKRLEAVDVWRRMEIKVSEMNSGGIIVAMRQGKMSRFMWLDTSRNQDWMEWLQKQ